MKTPSFLELCTIVEYIGDELQQSQMQEVTATEDGLVLSFYRFNREPRMKHLIFDLDQAYPMLVLLDENPWLKFKKTKPVGLFLSAHAKNRFFYSCQVVEELGRVVKIQIGLEEARVDIEFRAIPKQANLIVTTSLRKNISWNPVQELGTHNKQYLAATADEDIRSIGLLTQEWRKRRLMFKAVAANSSVNPFDRWVKNRRRDIEKKQKALEAVEKQVHQFLTEEWSVVGEHLKTYGKKDLKPEWAPYIDFELSATDNMQRCFEKAKAAKVKINGARQRIELLKLELENLTDLSEEKFKHSLILLENKQKKTLVRHVEGRLRKIELSEGEAVAYMGKSAADNMNLLRQSKPFDIWLHLKDYPSAHAVIHKQKNQSLSDDDLIKVARWLVQEGLSKSQIGMGGKYGVVFVECRHVKPLKGDKMGRVTYHNARELLIAL